jgi:hypothetical protein
MNTRYIIRTTDGRSRYLDAYTATNLIEAFKQTGTVCGVVTIDDEHIVASHIVSIEKVAA